MPTINALLVRQAVNCGDHAETITTAAVVHRDETVGAVLDRLLTKPGGRIVDGKWQAGQTADVDASLVLRLAVAVDADGQVSE